MKKAFTLLFLAATCLVVFGQDSLSVNKRSDNLIVKAYPEYNKNVQSTRGGKYDIYYQSKNDTLRYIRFEFYVARKGANADLEIKGIKTFILSGIWGRFLDTFPIYNQLRIEAKLPPLDEERKVELATKTILDESFDFAGWRYSFFRVRDGWKIDVIPANN